jgi:hypothetical protein
MNWLKRRLTSPSSSLAKAPARIDHEFPYQPVLRQHHQQRNQQHRGNHNGLHDPELGDNVGLGIRRQQRVSPFFEGLGDNRPLRCAGAV